MKRLIFTLLAVCLICVVSAQLEDRSFGGIRDEKAYSNQIMDDGMLLSAGYTESFTPFENDKDMFLVKTDPHGTVFWTRIYGDKGNDIAYSLAKTMSNKYLLAGVKNLHYDDLRAEFVGSVYVVCVNQFGDTQWTSIFGSANLNFANSIKATSDGGSILTGVVNQRFDRAINGYVSYLLILKLFPDGAVQWVQTFDWPSSMVVGTDIIIKIGGGYFIIGYILDQRTKSYSGLILQINDFGVFMTHPRIYGGRGDRIFYSGVGLPDRGMIIAGYYNAWGPGEGDGWIMKVTPEGDSLWTRRYGFPAQEECFYAVASSSTAGSFIFAGVQDKFGLSDAYFVKTNSNGSIMWEFTLGPPFSEVLRDIAVFRDNNYVFVGYSNSYGLRWDYYYLRYMF